MRNTRDQVRFVGRRTEMDRLRGLLIAARCGLRMALVTGEPGIGKTRLLDEFVATARNGNMAVLQGRASEFTEHVPLAVFADALGDLALDAQATAGLGDDTAALLRAAFPGPGDLAGCGHARLMAAERYRVHRATAALLEIMAKPGGLLLVLDDLHWADEGSLELLGHLLRRPIRARIVLAAACRPRQASVRLSGMLSDAERSGVAVLLELGPLTEQDATELLEPTTDTSRLRALYELSGGNPFYLDALARSAGRPDPNAPDAGVDNEIPMPVRAALLAEIAPLRRAEVRVAQAIAVVGDASDPGLVAATADYDLDRTLAAIDQLTSRDLIRSAGPRGSLCYRHPLQRTVIYQSAEAGWRIAAHGRAVEALRASGASPIVRAHHVQYAARYGDQHAVNDLQEAASAALDTAPAVAAHWVGMALELLAYGPATEATRLRLTEMLARALGMSGQLHSSRTALHELLRLLPAQPAERHARTVAFCAQIERLLGHHAEALALLHQELSSLTDQDGPAAVMLKLQLASGRLFGADFTTEPDCAWQALTAARQLPDRALLAAAIAMCVINGYSCGVLNQRTFDLLHEAATLVDGLLDGDLANHLEALAWLGWSETCLDRLADALRHLERGVRLARTTGQSHLMPYLVYGQANAYAMSGRLREAATCFEDAVEAAVLTGSDELRAIGLTGQCWMAVWRNDIAGALRFGEQAVASAGVVDDWYFAMAHAQLAHAHLYDGDPDACVALLLNGGGGPSLPRFDVMSRPCWFALLAAADATAHRTAEAVRWADSAQHVAESLGSSLRIGFAQLARAHALQHEEPADAASHALAAAESFREAGDRIHTGCGHLVAARALACSGHTERARYELGRASALFTACEAFLFQKQVHQAEKALILPAHPVASVDHGLTRRERTVLTLLAEGLTAETMGRRLGISHRTIHRHLASVYRKLDATDRLAAVLRAQSLGLLAVSPPVQGERGL